MNVGIIGVNGYAGLELLRILHNHPTAHLAVLASRSLAGQPLAAAGGHLRTLAGSDLSSMVIEDPQKADWSTCDIVFTAVPHGVSMELVPQLLEAGCRVIDLGADFRLPQPVYEQWYGPHMHPELIAGAVYGLPEKNRQAIAASRLIANPGCYATSMLLALLPLAAADSPLDLQAVHASASCVSGVSGAGRSPGAVYHYPERAANVQAYKAGSHRHGPEVLAHLESTANLTFVPHLVPTIRGIHSTIVLHPTGCPAASLHDWYKSYYAAEPFVRLAPLGEQVQTAWVQGTNYCDLSIFESRQSDSLIITSVIDNLGKGAAGQAVQNFNLLSGCAETTGLTSLALFP